MNITRNARTLLVALLGATVISASAAPGSSKPGVESTPPGSRLTAIATSTPPFPNIPAPGATPVDYDHTSTVLLKWTMGKEYGDVLTTVSPGRSQNFQWECWNEHDSVQLGSGTARVPMYRTTSWLVGYFSDGRGQKVAWPSTPVDLHDIGAQHRTATVLLRVVGDASKVTVYKVVDRGWVIPKGSMKREVVMGKPNRYHDSLDMFYEILPSQPVKTSVGLAYAERYMIESSDPATKIEVCYARHLPGDRTAQHEDGGPPSNPPITEG